MAEHSLYVIDMEAGRPVNAIKGVRAALRAMGGDGSLRVAAGVVDAVKAKGWAFVGDSDDLALVQAGAEAMTGGSDGAATPGVDVTDDDLKTIGDGAAVAPAAAEGEADADEGDFFSQAANSTALVLMAAANGNPTAALAFSASLGKATGDEALYEEVCRVLLDTFPPGPPIMVNG